MLVDVSAAFKHPDFIKELDGLTVDNASVKFVEEKRMAMVFEVTGLEGQEAIDFVKHYLKSLAWTKSIYFTVVKHL